MPGARCARSLVCKVMEAHKHSHHGHAGNQPTFPAQWFYGLLRAASWLRRQKVGKAVMEASGGYERAWAKALRDARIEVRIVDPKRVRSFAQSAGRLAKNDTIDAEMIAWFAETFDEARSQAYDATREQLHQMVNARQALKEMQAKLETQGEHEVPAAVQRMQARILKTIDLELVKIEAAISAMIQSTPHFTELAEIIESVPGIGRTTSAALIAAMPELGQANNKIVAALLGVAPYDDDSGRRRGERHIKGGRRRTSQRVLYGLSGGGDPAQSSPEGLLRPPGCQGERKEGGAGRLHAQADQHSQHHDRTAPKVGCQSVCIELIERRPCARSSTERLQSKKDR